MGVCGQEDEDGGSQDKHAAKSHILYINYIQLYQSECWTVIV